MAAALLVLFGFRESDSTWQKELRMQLNRVLNSSCFTCCCRRRGQPGWIAKALAAGGGEEDAPLVDETKANYAATSTTSV